MRLIFGPNFKLSECDDPPATAGGNDFFISDLHLRCGPRFSGHIHSTKATTNPTLIRVRYKLLQYPAPEVRQKVARVKYERASAAPLGLTPKEDEL